MRDRDRRAFEEWAAAVDRRLRPTAYLVTRDRELARDVVQEALMKTYQAWSRLDDERNATAYARKVVVNTGISWGRKKSTREIVTDFFGSPGADPSAEDIAGGAVSRDWVWGELGALPARQRAALVLRFYEDLSIAEIADILNCSEGTIKSQLSRGLRRLRQEILDEQMELGR